MRSISPFLLVLAIIILIFCPVMSQDKVNLTGTWKGATVAEGPDVELELILVLKHEDETITGNLKDDIGYITSEITEAKLDKDVFTFKSVAETPDGDVGLTFTMTVKGDEMKGSWEAEDGVSGSWTAKKEKLEK